MWKVGAVLRLSGQQAHARLQKAGYNPRNKPFSEEEQETVRKYYANTPADVFSLDQLSLAMKRTKPLICRFARKMGLTNQHRPLAEATRAKISPRITALWMMNGHPRGMLGKKHSEAVKLAMGERSKARWEEWRADVTSWFNPDYRERAAAAQSARMIARSASQTYSRGKHGKRKDLNNIYFRSMWEANYARYLNIINEFGYIKSWSYENKIFPLYADHMPRTYCPDFEVVLSDNSIEFHEVKGFMDERSLIKLTAMEALHPEVCVRVIGKTEYLEVQKEWSAMIPEWETYDRLKS